MNCDCSSKKIEIRVLFFAKSRELSGVSEAEFTLDTGHISTLDLLTQISQKFGLESLKSCIVLAINQSYCDIGPEELLHLREGDEIAVIPPLSGG